MENLCSFYKHCLLAKAACTADQMENCTLASKGEFIGNCNICGQKRTVCRLVNEWSRPCKGCVSSFIKPLQQKMRGG